MPPCRTLPAVQFILKKRSYSWCPENYSSGSGFSSGLYNSARLVCEMLSKHGYITDLTEVQDNNSIDREVTRFRPDIVIIEAYWVVPEKFKVLAKLHPKVKWIIRNHSEIPFLATEGIAIGWTKHYAQQPNVFLSCNSRRAQAGFRAFIDPAKEVFLPNYYPVEKPGFCSILRNFSVKPKPIPSRQIHISCPGAIRPLKNQLIQAIAAVAAAQELKRDLCFHINGGRVENGDSVIKSLRSLFAEQPGAVLVEEPWRNYEDFISWLKNMDVVMQVSYSETFNISAANAVEAGAPLVTSSEVRWSDPAFQADCNSVLEIKRKIIKALRYPRPELARFLLAKYVKKVPEEWDRGLSFVLR